jgi:hypothetical protein
MVKIGYFSDLEPYIQKLVTPRKMWRVIQRQDKPFYYICSQTGLITAPIHLELTDLGSVPEVMHWIVDEAEYVPPFIIHDNEYFRRFALRPLFPYLPGDANLNGLIARYVFEPDEVVRMAQARENFEIVRVDKAMADYALSEAIFTYAPDDTFKRILVYRAVRMWGLISWMNKGNQRDYALKLAWAERQDACV